MRELFKYSLVGIGAVSLFMLWVLIIMGLSYINEWLGLPVFILGGGFVIGLVYKDSRK